MGLIGWQPGGDDCFSARSQLSALSYQLSAAAIRAGASTTWCAEEINQRNTACWSHPIHKWGRARASACRCVSISACMEGMVGGVSVTVGWEYPRESGTCVCCAVCAPRCASAEVRRWWQPLSGLTQCRPRALHMALCAVAAWLSHALHGVREFCASQRPSRQEATATVKPLVHTFKLGVLFYLCFR